jgi:A/G-specific adenine glycosylase
MIMSKDEFINKLLRWGSKHQRKFPWRRTKNPFHILTAEMMLQKTNAEKVAKIYPGFIKKYKTPYILARADIRTLKKELHYLGIHARAKRMKLAAAKIEREFNGKVPQNKESLLSLPGAGPYVANAVLCFAFNKDVALVDTNVIKILKTYLNIKSKQKRARSDRRLWLMMEKMIPPGRGKLFNRSMLDLSAYIKKNKKSPI